MRIPRDALDEFRSRWREQFGEELSHDAAMAEAERVVRTIYRLLVLNACDLSTREADGGTPLDAPSST